MSLPSVLLIDRISERPCYPDTHARKMRAITKRMDDIAETIKRATDEGRSLQQIKAEVQKEWDPVASQWEVLQSEAHGEIAREIREKAVESGVIVTVDDAADWLNSHLDTKDLGFSDIPNAAPPFPRFWVETTVGRNDEKSPQRIGIWVESEELKNGLNSTKTHPDEHWRVTARPFFEGTAAIYAIRPFTYSTDKLGNFIQLPELEDGRGLRSEDVLMVHTLLFAVSFMHCKNVKLTAGTCNKKLSKARERKGKLPLVRYRTLVIDGMKQVLSREGNYESTGLKKALHLCRGHFRVYTPERPLFGRVVGQVWVPQHARGKMEHGIVVKDYKIKMEGRSGH